MQSITISAVLGILSLVIPCSVNLGQFMYTINKLKKERQNIFLKLVVKTPKNDYLLLKKRLDDVDKDMNETDIDNTSDMN